MKLSFLSILSLLVVSQISATPGILDVDQFSTTNFTGNSSASGTTINITNDSTVNFQDQSTAGNASISIDTSSELDFMQSSASTYSGQLSGTGTVIKNGTGDLTLSGNNSAFTGPLLVETGTVILDGSYGGNIIGSPGTNIIYNGPILGNLTVNGGVITTSGVNTLNVGGNYFQINNATYIANVNSLGQSSLINIAGTASISGFVQANTSAGVLFYHTYTILHAAGGVTGSYSLTGSYPGLLVRLFQDGSNVYLLFDPNFVSIATTPNQINIATQLDGLTTLTSDEAYVLGALSALDPAGQRSALDAMSGEQYTTFILNALYSDGLLSGRIFDAYRNLWNCCIPQCCDRLHYWASSSANGGFQHGPKATPGFHQASYAIDFGVHSFLGERGLIGGAIGYQRESMHEKLGGHAFFNTTQFAFYSGYRSPIFYFRNDFIAAMSWGNYKRPIDFGTLFRKANSSPKLIHGRAYLEIGADFGGCPFYAEPFLGWTGEIYHQFKIHEQGAKSLNLVLNSKTRFLTSSLLGIRLSESIRETLNITIDLAWQHYFGNLRASEQTHFAEFGTPFLIQGPKRGHDGGLASIYFSVDGDCLAFYIKAAGQVWKDWTSYEISGGLHY